LYKIEPLTLTGRIVRLEPLQETHVPDLCRVGFDPEIWRWMLYGNIDSEEKMRWFVRRLLEWQSKGETLPFAVIHREEGRAIGCTRYMELAPERGGLEIGGTWYGREYQRTGVNTECKFLLLRQAFEVYSCIRVQLKTDRNNLRSQGAIERLGAVKEGILRNHMIRPDGTVRDTVYYSILDQEWPVVKEHLERMMER
jgi:N-acetyltransferase